jgi:hypothetical protein
VTAEKPALASYAGKRIALGVRSEDMEDASIPKAGEDSRIKGKIVLTEALGSEIIVHFTFPGEPVVTEDTKLVAEESGGGELHLGDAAGVRRVASFAPRSRVHMGDEVEVAVDVERAHFFDPDVGPAIRQCGPPGCSAGVRAELDQVRAGEVGDPGRAQRVVRATTQVQHRAQAGVPGDHVDPGEVLARHREGPQYGAVGRAAGRAERVALDHRVLGARRQGGTLGEHLEPALGLSSFRADPQRAGPQP